LIAICANGVRAENTDVPALSPRFVLRRTAAAAALVFVVSSAALVLSDLAPGDFVTTTIGGDRAVAAAERQRLRLDRPFTERYREWIARAATLDLGDSFQYRRPVLGLVRERAANTAVLGLAALLVATLLGIPAGVLTGSRRGPLPAVVRGTSLGLMAMPPLITSFVLITLAARTGWFPVAGIGGLRHLVVPTLSLALPLAAMLERLQSDAIRDALARTHVIAAAARGIPSRRLVWRHAWRVSLGPVLGVYGVVIGALFSGSFIVEVVASWPGLASLMRDALVTRDAPLVAGCAAAGAVFLAAGVLISDLTHAAVDPRVETQGA
jgi:ABC-type dipeptide/oligopeptide/nickel transport system permease component